MGGVHCYRVAVVAGLVDRALAGFRGCIVYAHLLIGLGVLNDCCLFLCKENYIENSSGYVMSSVREMSAYRRLLYALLSVLFGIVLMLVILEVGFRLMPVSHPPKILPVDDENRIAMYEKNIQYIWSKGWNFAIATNKQTNNYGFVNDIDYQDAAPGAVMVIIGDSFVEAQQVDNKDSVPGLLTTMTSGSGLVYSVAMMGAPLSQYLAYAEFSRDEFSPNSMVFVIISNDYDESLAKYNVSPRFHYFFEDDDGELSLEHTHYSMSDLKKLLRHSAFVRYVIFNLEAGAVLRSLKSRDAAEVNYVGNVRADFSTERLEDSKRAVREFFNRLPIMSGLQVDRILFVVDGLRTSMYSEQARQQTRNSYVYRMREYFIKMARRMGYETVDMQQVFEARYQADGSHFEFPTDGHWNRLGHAMVAGQIMNSAVYRGAFQVPTTTDAPQ